jgi:hypothetical protein
MFWSFVLLNKIWPIKSVSSKRPLSIKRLILNIFLSCTSSLWTLLLIGSVEFLHDLVVSVENKLGFYYYLAIPIYDIMQFYWNITALLLFLVSSFWAFILINKLSGEHDSRRDK